jgi:hypothetical protein
MAHYPPERDDRASLKALLVALDASETRLQRDPPIRKHGNTGDWAIYGTLGRIYPDGDGYLLYVTTEEKVGANYIDRKPSSRPWNGAKSRLSFCRVTQDGDFEGCLRLERLPAPHEAIAIRESLGIRKRRIITDEARARLEAARSLIISPKRTPYIEITGQGATHS